MKATSKKYLRIGWLSLVMIVLGIYYFLPSTFNYEQLELLIEQNKELGLLMIFGLHILRSFIFIPASPLIILSVILFPDNLLTLLIVNWLGMSCSAIVIFALSNYLDFDHLLKKKPTAVSKITHRLNKQSGFWYVFIWSFIPVVSSDLLCFIAGSLKIKFPHFISAFSMGTFFLCSMYIYGTSFIQFQF